MHESLEQLEQINAKLDKLRLALGLLASGPRGAVTDNTAGLSGADAAAAAKLKRPSTLAVDFDRAATSLRRSRKNVQATTQNTGAITVSTPEPDLDCLVTVALDAAHALCRVNDHQILPQDVASRISQAVKDLESLLPARPKRDPNTFYAQGGISSSSLEVIPSLSWS